MVVSRPTSDSLIEVRSDTRHIVGRYALYGLIGAGGMASVHLGRLLGPIGFSRTVAVKRMHPHLLEEPEFVSMFVDEARLASRVRHPNVVATLDVVDDAGELLLVMEYVHGVALWHMIKRATERSEHVPINVLASIMSGVLQGLHAAHEAKGDARKPLGLVHRDVSPHNILVGVDGVARVLDFGVAKAAQRSYSTRVGHTRGKVRYMAPEQLLAQEIDRRVDIFAAGIVLWEGLTGKRLFDGVQSNALVRRILSDRIPEPREYNPTVPERLNNLVMRALERDPEQRFQTARDFSIELEHSVALASTREVGEWVERYGGQGLERRADAVAQIESVGSDADVKRELAEMHARRTRTSSESLSQSGERIVESKPRSEPRFIERNSITLTAPPGSGPSTLTPSEASSLNIQPERFRSNLQLAAFGLVIAALSFITVWKFAPSDMSETPYIQQHLKVSSGLGVGALAATTVAAPSLPNAAPLAPGVADQRAHEPATNVTVADAETKSPSPTLNLDEPAAAPEPVVKKAAPKKRSRRRAPARRSVRKPVSSQAATADRCAVPFYFDAQGIKHPIKACL